MSVIERLTSTNLTVKNSLFSIAEKRAYGEAGQETDSSDIGYFGTYWDGITTKYTGIFRDSSDPDKSYIFYDNLSVLPDISSGLVDTKDASFNYASIYGKTLKAYSTATSTSTTTGAIVASGGMGIAENLNVGGSLTVLGANATLGCGQLSIYDNIVVDNVSDIDGNYAGDDSGYVSARVPASISAHDSAKLTSVSLFANFFQSDVKITIASNASGSDYYAGWAIKKLDSGETRLIVADTDNKNGSHTITIESAFGSAGTANSTQFNLYNKTNVGWVWDESTGYLTSYGFPRDGLAVLDPDAKDGSAPEYANVQVGNLAISGTIDMPQNPIKALTITNSTQLTKQDVTNYAMFYVNAAYATTVTLPNTTTLGIANTAYRFTIANLSPNSVTISRAGTDVIEGELVFLIKRRYEKMTFISFDGGWLIE